jgi:gamma-glutamylcyclotransferase (GGCT)/AIG2-like uncharacterized protein YtfP
VPPLLVLYGSLRRGEESYRKLDLDRRLRFLSRCAVRGRLYDLGPYPAFVEGDGITRGELFEPADATILADLDAFEGYDPADPAGSWYVRQPIRLDGPSAEAFIYRYNGPVDGRPEIVSGDWVAYRLARDAA